MPTKRIGNFDNPEATMRVTRRQPHLPAMLLALLLGACGGASDTTSPPPPASTGSVVGQVTDGAVGVAGATLTLEMAGQNARTATSAVNGGYSFAQVPVGTWSLTVVAPAGFTISGSGVSAVSVTAGGTATQDFTLARSASGTTVDIANFAFSPDTLTVPVGTKVTFQNDDSVTHTATDDAGEFDSGNIPYGESFSHTFATVGTFRYHCSIHSQMTGTIKVQ